MPCNVASRNPYPKGGRKATQESLIASLKRPSELTFRDVCTVSWSSLGQLFFTRNIKDQTAKLKIAETIKGSASWIDKSLVINGERKSTRLNSSHVSNSYAVF